MSIKNKQRLTGFSAVFLLLCGIVTGGFRLVQHVTGPYENKKTQALLAVLLTLALATILPSACLWAAGKKGYAQGAVMGTAAFYAGITALIFSIIA